MATSGTMDRTANSSSPPKGHVTDRKCSARLKSLPRTVFVGRNDTPIAAAFKPRATVKFECSSISRGYGTPSSAARLKLCPNPAATFPTQEAMTRRTQPAPMSWSNWISEIGAINVRSLFFCRMISYPAAKGIRDSRVQPIATAIPSSISSVIASRRLHSLSMDSYLPTQAYFCKNSFLTIMCRSGTLR